ncbi:MAG: GNAT family N-acetyltransferase [Candidatus Thiodiazotropha sp.]
MLRAPTFRVLHPATLSDPVTPLESVEQRLTRSPVLHCKRLDSTCRQELAALFTSVFSASEGLEEGRLVGDLASQLAAKIDDRAIICASVCDESASILGAAFLTPLGFDHDWSVYMLAPVAVATPHQGQGIGQALIKFALGALKARSVDVVVTYGDPAFYSKVGFGALSEKVIQAPLRLSMPGGWLGQSLTGRPIPVIQERPKCVREFNDPAYW